MKLSKLQTRVTSGLLIIPPVILIVYLGGIYFTVFIGAALGIAIFEWFRMAKATKYVGVVVVFGLLYLAVSFYSFYQLRMMPEIGGFFTTLAFICVWGSDSAAYLFGKLLKGPRMAPYISPNKTFSGLLGAMVAPIIALYIGNLAAPYFEHVALGMSLFFIICFGAVLGLIAQAGDLLISLLKRKAGVKDSGRLIPGHGGLLDRIDALILVAPVFYLVVRYYL